MPPRLRGLKPTSYINRPEAGLTAKARRFECEGGFGISAEILAPGGGLMQEFGDAKRAGFFSPFPH